MNLTSAGMAKAQFTGRVAQTGSKWVSIEKFEVDRIYAFTFNPSDQPENFDKAHIVMWHNKNLRYLREHVGMEFTLYLELNNGNRWHYHGLVRFSSLMTYILFRYDMALTAQTYMDTISDPVVWFLYLRKQKEMRSKLLHFNLLSGGPLLINEWLRENNLIFGYLPMSTLEEAEACEKRICASQTPYEGDRAARARICASQTPTYNNRGMERSGDPRSYGAIPEES